MEAAARRLRGRPALPVGPVVIKLNDGFSGQGNAVVDLAGHNGSLLDSPVVFCAEEESWSLTRPRSSRAARRSCWTCRAWSRRACSCVSRPGGEPMVLSTHSQVLGGPNRQVYLGCRFPADVAYRDGIRQAAERVGRELAGRGVIGYFGVDFFVVPERGRQRVFLSEINLRVGGTTHPFGMASLVTDGCYDVAGGYLVAGGRAKSYLATDNLKSSLAGRLPAPGDHRPGGPPGPADHRRRVGTTIHPLGRGEHGKMGVTRIGDTEEEARSATARWSRPPPEGSMSAHGLVALA